MACPFAWILPAALIALPLESLAEPAAEPATTAAPADAAAPASAPPQTEPTAPTADSGAPLEASPPAAGPEAVPAPTGTAEATPDPSPTPGPLEAARSVLARVEIGGIVSTSYTYNFNRPESGLNVGRGYDASANEPMLNKALLKLTLPVEYDPAAFKAGFSVKLLFGQDARFTQSALALGDFGDLFEAAATVNVPLGRGLKVTVGKYSTPIGYESAFLEEAPNWSGGLAWTSLEPFNHTGLGLRYAFSGAWEAELLVNSGWDVVGDNNHGKSGILHLAFTPAEGTAVHLSGFAGPEQDDNTRDWRLGANLFAEHRWTSEFRTALQVDYGSEPFADAAGGRRLAQWWAAGVWLVLQPEEVWGLALRVDVLGDPQGVRTSGSPSLAPFPTHSGMTLFSTTLTVNLTPVQGLRVAPELRWDYSTLEGGAFEGEPSRLTLALGVAYLF